MEGSEAGSASIDQNDFILGYSLNGDEGEQNEPEMFAEKESRASDASDWKLCGENNSRSEIVFLCQVFILYIVIITCILNLSLRNGDSNLWTALLSSSLGILLPGPKFSKKIKTIRNVE
jgi:hypothetical protein